MPPVPDDLPQGSCAVIFISKLKAEAPGYEQTARRMVELVESMPGFLGLESWRDADGRGVTISYWRDENAIAGWRDHPEHAEARRRGDEQWYDDWRIQVCRIEQARRKG